MGNQHWVKKKLTKYNNQSSISTVGGAIHSLTGIPKINSVGCRTAEKPPTAQTDDDGRFKFLLVLFINRDDGGDNVDCRLCKWFLSCQKSVRWGFFFFLLNEGQHDVRIKRGHGASSVVAIWDNLQMKKCEWRHADEVERLSDCLRRFWNEMRNGMGLMFVQLGMCEWFVPQWVWLTRLTNSGIFEMFMYAIIN